MTVMASQSPFDNRLLGQFELTQKDAITTKIEQCRTASKIWAAVPIKKRAKILATLRNVILSDLDTLSDCISANTGKVPTEALLGDILPVLSLLDYYVKNAASILADRKIATSPFLFPATSCLLYTSDAADE